MNKLNSIFEANLTTEFYQFYLVDGEESESPTQLFNNEEDFNSRIDISEGFVGIRTERNGDLKINFLILDNKPQDENIENYDHIVEGSIEITSGHMLIKDCPDFETVKDIQLPKGIYRIRVYSSNLSSIISEYEGNDFYKIIIWKDDKFFKKNVIKM